MIKKILFCFVFLFYTTTFANTKRPLIVILDWFINPNHAPLFVAEQEGFFQQQGITVQIIQPADTFTSEAMVAANQADIAVTYQPTLILKTTNGLPLVHFATLIDTPLNALVVLKNKQINTLKDLKGKQVGISAPEIDKIMLATMLKTVGLNLNDVKLINVKFNLIQALLTGNIDGFIGGMRNVEPVVIESAGKSIKMFYPEKYGFPLYDELILVTNKNKINDPRLPKFIKALQQGIIYLRKNPQICWKKFAANHPELNNTTNRKIWFLTLPYFANDPTKLNQKRYQKLTRFINS